jgi:hypothetical protein
MLRPKMCNRNDLMLVRIAQGDAYGMATEYIKLPRDQATQDQALEFTKYVANPKHNLRPGQYTDDTQMSLAVPEVWHDRVVGTDTIGVTSKAGPQPGGTRRRHYYSEGCLHAFNRMY